jgi:hypothetical protein
MDADTLRSRILDRLTATGKKRVPVSVAIGKGRDYLSNFLNGDKESIGIEVIQPLARELGCSVQYLVDADYDPAIGGEVGPVIQIRGNVGASTEGRVQFATGDTPNDIAIMPQGVSPGSVALYVRGGSMPGIADEGSLIFYEEVRSPPTPDMLGQVVVVETEDNQVLVKRLLRGERRGLYDLESIGSELLQNKRLRWAAHIQAIVPPYRARQIIRKLAA